MPAASARPSARTPGAVRRDGDDRKARVDQRLEVRPLAADEHADHASLHATPSTPASSRPMTTSAGLDVGGRHDGAVADPDVEDAAQLVLGHAVLGEPGEDRRPLPRRRGRSTAPTPSGRTRARFPAIPPPVTCASARTSARARSDADVVEVAAGRGQQQVGVERVVADDPPHEREAVRVDPRGRQPDDDVAVPGARAVDQVVAVDEAHDRAAEVELLVAVDPRQLGRLAAEDRAAGGAADVGGALDELRDLLRVDRVRGDVVEEEERLGARRQDVVDPVRGEVGAAPAELPGAARQHELRADGVGRGGEQAPLVDREEPGERAEAPTTAGVRVESTAARRRSTTASAVASETPAAAYVWSSGGTVRA